MSFNDVETYRHALVILVLFCLLFVAGMTTLAMVISHAVL
jgi:hypothetical protein